MKLILFNPSSGQTNGRVRYERIYEIQSILDMLSTWEMVGIDEKDRWPKDIFTLFGSLPSISLSITRRKMIQMESLG